MLDARGRAGGANVGAAPMIIDDVIDEDKENSDTGSKNTNSRGRGGAKPKTSPPARGKSSRGGRAATTSRAKASAATPKKNN